MSKRCNEYNQSFKGLKIKFFKVLYLRTGCVRENAPPEQNKRSSIFLPHYYTKPNSSKAKLDHKNI